MPRKSIPTIESYSPETFKAEIEAVKIMGGEETTCFELKLHINGCYAATVTNSGTDGCHTYQWDNTTLKAMFDRHIQHLISQGAFQFELLANDEFIDQLLENWEMKKLCKKSTIVKLKTHQPGEYLQFKNTYSEAVKQQIIQKFGDRLVEIVNERFVK